MFRNSELADPMGMERAALRTLSCLHCGKPADDGEFCCFGCETVYGILKKQGRPLAHADAYKSFDQVPGFEHALYIEGIHCSACVWLLEKLPEFLGDHVESSRLDLGRSILTLQLRPNGKLSLIAETLHTWGYTPRVLKQEGDAERLLREENRRALLKLGVAGAITGNVMLLSLPYYADASIVQTDLGLLRVCEWAQLALALPSLLYCGSDLIRNSWVSVTQRRFSIDLPIVLALFAAFGLSTWNLFHGGHELFFDSQVTLIFLLLASRYLLQRFRQRGLGGAEFLLFEKTTDVTPGSIVDLDVTGRLRFDAQILEGELLVDQAILTGESSPVSFGPSDAIYAGTDVVAIQGKLCGKVRALVTATGSETRIEKILQSARDRLQKRALLEHVYDRWAKRVLIAMTALGAGAFVVLAWRGQWEVGALRWITLLIVTCPCSLALGTPLAIRLGVRRAFRHGLLVQDVDVFEKLQRVRHAFFDKTGTLTEGRLQVSEDTIPAEDRAALFSMVSRSRHPVSRAILSYLMEEFGSYRAVELRGFREIPGQGIEAATGNLHYSLKRGTGTAASPSQFTVVELKLGGATRGKISLRDRIRDEASSVIDGLHRRGVLVEVLSGDRESVVEAAARKVGADVAHGEMSPENKVEAIRGCESRGIATLMVGDGVNDAAALAEASVSFGVRGALDEVLKNAGVVSSREGLAPVATLFEVSDRVMWVLRRNLWISTAYNVGAGALAVSGMVTPLLAALVMPMAATTVFVFTATALKTDAEKARRRA